MKISISFKHLEHTPALDERIHLKTKQLEKFLDGATSVEWTCSAKEGTHYSEIKIVGPSFSYHATATSDNLYKTFDMVVHKIERQLEKKKDKNRNKMHKKGEEPVFLEPDSAWIEHADEEEGLKKAV